MNVRQFFIHRSAFIIQRFLFIPHPSALIPHPYSSSVASRTCRSCSRRNARRRSRKVASSFAKIATASSAAFSAPAAPIAKVPTGTPPGICTMESRESKPFKARLSTGTPSTGKRVCAATMPGRCAAPPAPAMVTFKPRASACAANSAIHTGVRCAETTRHSCATPNSVSTWAACRIVSQSDVLPMMTATSGDEFCASGISVLLSVTVVLSSDREAGLAVEGAQVLGLDEIETGVRYALQERGDLRVLDCATITLRGEAAAPVVGAEGFGQAFGPDLDAAVVDDRQLEIAGERFERSGQLIGCAR